VLLGQLTCYDGRELTWDQVAKSDFVFAPKVEDVRLDMEPPVRPDVQGWYPVPMPGMQPLNV
jgi:myo-inositol 2-dehydrogenase / D-chiro-inositol 1-dehydrogenase